MNAPTSFIVLADGHLLVPADQMTGLLRQVAAGWLQATDQGYEDHDPATVLSLATGLMEIADQIDAECIGLMPMTDGDEEGTGEALGAAYAGPDAAPDDGPDPGSDEPAADSGPDGPDAEETGGDPGDEGGPS
ncbi:DUF6213 family protein [Streptomyces sp. NPDC006339]|uniref:DUF6213 family protein n=1 Tax=Streptomyces sp. NPDC006339 TaxID=3156755 RepID=UPI0033A5B2FA